MINLIEEIKFILVKEKSEWIRKVILKRKLLVNQKRIK